MKSQGIHKKRIPKIKEIELKKKLQEIESWNSQQKMKQNLGKITQSRKQNCQNNRNRT